MSTSAELPHDEPAERPSAARMYDYFLGGYHNLAIDRQLADAATALYPEFPRLLQTNRAFLRRAVTFLVEQGIDQFLDIGSGIPTVGNVHEIAQQRNPAARVVYVDIDPVAVSQSKAILEGNAAATAIQVDAQQPEAVLGHAEVRRLLRPDRPFAVLLVAFLHFITDNAQAAHLVQVLREALPPGGYLVLSHASYDGAPREIMAQLEALYAQTPSPVRSRTKAQIAAFFTGLELVEPGLVYTPLWRPEGPDDLFLAQPERALAFAGVGRKLPAAVP